MSGFYLAMLQREEFNKCNIYLEASRSNLVQLDATLAPTLAARQGFAFTYFSSLHQGKTCLSNPEVCLRN